MGDSPSWSMQAGNPKASDSPCGSGGKGGWGLFPWTHFSLSIKIERSSAPAPAKQLWLRAE